jgi:hypothetical protein
MRYVYWGLLRLEYELLGGLREKFMALPEFRAPGDDRVDVGNKCIGPGPYL